MIVDDFSRYSWVFFMESKDEAFSHARDLILQLQNEFPKNAMRVINSDNAQNSRILILKPFVLLWASSISFPLLMSLSKMVLLSAKIGLWLKWLGRCSTSIGLLEDIRLKQSTLHVMCQIAFPSGFYEEDHL